MVTSTLAHFEVSAKEVALTVTTAGLGTLAGAVYRPVLLSVPQAAPVHPAPERLQVTVPSAVLYTVASNWTDCVTTTWAVSGVIDTTIGGGGITPPDPQARNVNNDKADTTTQIAYFMSPPLLCPEIFTPAMILRSSGSSFNPFRIRIG
jgi:hypothetical protein